MPHGGNVSEDFEIQPVGKTITQRHVESAQTTLTGVQETLRRFYNRASCDRRQAAVKTGWALDDALADLFYARQQLLRELRSYDDELLARLEEQHDRELRERVIPTSEPTSEAE